MNHPFTSLAFQAAVSIFGLFVGTTIAKDIYVAQIGPFTGLPSPDAHDVNLGARAYFEQINAAGGIAGNRIILEKFDDKFTGPEFLNKLAQVNAEKRFVALLSPIGSQALTALFAEKKLDDSDLVVINAIPGSDAFRLPGHPSLFHVRAGDTMQIRKIMTHSKVLGLLNMVVVHQDLPIGVNGMKVAKATAESLTGFNLKALSSKHDDAEINAATTTAVKDDSLESALVIGTPKFSADAIAALRKKGFIRQIYALSYVPAGLVVKTAGVENAKGVAIVQTFPPPNATGTPSTLQRNLQEAIQRVAPEVKAYSHFHLEGYISARVLAEGIRRAGSSVTHSTIAKALRSAGPMNIDGFEVNFQKNNQGSLWTDFAVISRDGSLRY